MKKICYIISAGDCAGINITKNNEDYVIAADGGYKYAKKAGIIPNMVVGDFDSLGYVPNEENVIVHSPMKDDTDTMLAVKEGMKRGYRHFEIYGALGGRIDHTIANIQTLIYIKKRNGNARIIGDNNIFTVISDEKIVLPKRDNGMFSVFSMSDTSKNVSIKNAKYNVENVQLHNDFPLGVSNEFDGMPVEISVTDGTLLIIYDCKKELADE